MTDPRQVLAENLAKLPQKDLAFATSLLGAAKPSEKQLYWIAKLANRVTGSEAIPVNVVVGEIQPIVDMIAAAKGHKKSPAILLATSGGEVLRISVAGPMAKVPGSINVKSRDKLAADGRPVWYGRVTVNGVFQPAKSMDADTVALVTNTMVRFAADPAGVAAQFGIETHHCCFCAKLLTHPDSKAVGYGPDCAANFSLPWGVKATKALTCEEVA